MTIDWGVMLALLGSMAALVTALSGRRKVNAEAESTLSKAALDMVQEIRKDVDALKADNARLRAENVQLRADLDAMQDRIEDKDRQIEELMEGVQVLCSQVKQQGQEPWFKPKRKPEVVS